MAYRVSQDKADLIASNYMSNGFQKVKALIDSGYRESYASSVGLKLYDNVRVKESISRIQAGVKTKTNITVASIQSELEQVQADAKAKGDIQGQLRALELKGKTIAAYTDNSNIVQTDKPVDISDTERQELQQAAIRLTRTA